MLYKDRNNGHGNIEMDKWLRRISFQPFKQPVRKVLFELHTLEYFFNEYYSESEFKTVT